MSRQAARWSSGGRLICVGLIATVLVCAPGLTPAQPVPTKPGTAAESRDDVDGPTVRGHDAFLRGVEFSHNVQWGKALAAFQEAAAERNAPIIQFNIGYCQRALGHYVAARLTLRNVLSELDAVDPERAAETRGYLQEIETLLVNLSVFLEPANAALTVDGRPLVLEDRSRKSYLAGIAAPGAAASLGESSFSIWLDSGAHVFRALQPGHADVVVNRSYRDSERASLNLHLEALPATVSIRSEPLSAIVRIDDREVGVAPLEVQRPAGKYHIEVERAHYDLYRGVLDLQAGQAAALTARLNPTKDSITKHWWFWAGTGATILTGILVTYIATRPTAAPPPYDGGSAGWVVQGR